MYLTREYVVEIEADSEEAAQMFTSLYVSGGVDESNELIRQQNNFKIHNIKPTLNDSFCVEELEN